MVAGPAFLFDLDGTLVDSVYQHVLAWQDALDQTGIELAVWRIHRKIGMSGGLFANALLRETGRAVTPEEADRLRVLHGEAYASRVDRVRPLPGARELLEHLTASRSRGRSRPAATSRARVPTLEGLGIPETTPVITRDQVAHAKPDPDLFLPPRRRWASTSRTRSWSATACGTCSRPVARERWASGCCPAATARRSSSAPAPIACTRSRPTCSVISTSSACDDRDPGDHTPTAERLLDVRTPAELAFAPDGSRVAFALHSTVADVGSFVPSDLYVVDVGGGDPVKLTEGHGAIGRRSGRPTVDGWRSCRTGSRRGISCRTR